MILTNSICIRHLAYVLLWLECKHKSRKNLYPLMGYKVRTYFRHPPSTGCASELTHGESHISQNSCPKYFNFDRATNCIHNNFKYLQCAPSRFRKHSILSIPNIRKLKMFNLKSTGWKELNRGQGFEQHISDRYEKETKSCYDINVSPLRFLTYLFSHYYCSKRNNVPSSNVVRNM